MSNNAINDIKKARSLSMVITEVFVIFFVGVLAAFLHAKLRIPLKMPGHHGLEFMFIMMTVRSLSGFKFATSISAAGAMSFAFLPFGGFNDPIMPLSLLLPGIIIDILYFTLPKWNKNILILGLFAGIAYAMIPLIRLVFSSFTGYIYPNMVTTPFYPIISHFIWGLAGGLLSTGIIKLAKK